MGGIEDGELEEEDVSDIDPVTFVNSMSRKDLILYLEENLGDEAPPQLKDISEEQVNDYKRFLLAALTNNTEELNKIEENGEIEIVEEDILQTSVDSNVSTERVEQDAAEPEVITLDDGSDDDDGSVICLSNLISENNTTVNPSNRPNSELSVQSKVDDDQQQENEPESTTKIKATVIIVKTGIRPKEKLDEKIKRWTKYNHDSYSMEFNCPTTPEVPEYEDEVNLLYYKDSPRSAMNCHDDDDDDESWESNVGDKVEEFCGGGLLIEKIRVDGYGDADDPDDCFMNIFQVPSDSNYERENFTATCNLCNGQQITNHKNLGEHVKTEEHKKNLVDLSLKFVGVEPTQQVRVRVLPSKEEKITQQDCNGEKKESKEEESKLEKVETQINCNLVNNNLSIEDSNPSTCNGPKVLVSTLRCSSRSLSSRSRRSRDRSLLRDPKYRSRSPRPRDGSRSTGKSYRSRSRGRRGRNSRSRDYSRSRGYSGSRDYSRSRGYSGSRDYSRSRYRTKSRPRIRSRSPRPRRRSRTPFRSPLSRGRRNPRKYDNRRRNKRSPRRGRSIYSRSRSRSFPRKAAKSPLDHTISKLLTATPPPSTSSAMTPILNPMAFNAPKFQLDRAKIDREKAMLQINHKWTTELETRWKLLQKEETRLEREFTKKRSEIVQELGRDETYSKEWGKFWHGRHSELAVLHGKEFADRHDYSPEWALKWRFITESMIQKQFSEEINAIRLKYGLDVLSLKALNMVLPGEFIKHVKEPTTEEILLTKNDEPEVSRAGFVYSFVPVSPSANEEEEEDEGEKIEDELPHYSIPSTPKDEASKEEEIIL